jgi:hypothetical protein
MDSHSDAAPGVPEPHAGRRRVLQSRFPRPETTCVTQDAIPECPFPKRAPSALLGPGPGPALGRRGWASKTGASGGRWDNYCAEGIAEPPPRPPRTIRSGQLRRSANWQGESPPPGAVVAMGRTAPAGIPRRWNTIAFVYLSSPDSGEPTEGDRDTLPTRDRSGAGRPTGRAWPGPDGGRARKGWAKWSDSPGLARRPVQPPPSPPWLCSAGFASCIDRA